MRQRDPRARRLRQGCRLLNQRTMKNAAARSAAEPRPRDMFGQSTASVGTASGAATSGGSARWTRPPPKEQRTRPGFGLECLRPGRPPREVLQVW